MLAYVHLFDTVMRSVTFVYLFVCLFVCPVRTLTFESTDPQTSFLTRRYVFRISTLNLYIKVIGSRSRSRSQEQKNRHSVYCGRVSVFDCKVTFLHYICKVPLTVTGRNIKHEMSAQSPWNNAAGTLSEHKLPQQETIIEQCDD